MSTLHEVSVTMMDVFGITFPIFEIMLVFIVLLTAGLIFILIELKKLNEYLSIERQDLQRLERDLTALEAEEQRLNQDEQTLGLATQRRGPQQ